MTEEEELAVQKERHRKRVERRGKYLATLNPKQRLARDRYIHWVRVWREHNKAVCDTIAATKKFIRAQGHNDLKALNLARKTLADLRHEASVMMYARQMAKSKFASAVQVAA